MNEVIAVYYNEDWDEAKERFKAWWDGEFIDRPPIQVVAPKKGYTGSLGFWPLDLAWRMAHNPENLMENLKEFEKRCEGTFYGGEAYPHIGTMTGSAEMPALLGGVTIYLPERGNVWDHANYDPSLAMGWKDLLEIHMDLNEWEKIKNITKFLLEHSDGKYRVWNSVTGWMGDTLAALRGSQNLVIDMYRRPDNVRTFSKRFFEVWSSCFDEIHSMIREKQNGTDCQALALWHPGRTVQTQCDFAAMLSPRLYKEFILPSVREQCQHVDASIYHLDGVEALYSLDDILDITELNVIQWSPSYPSDVGDPEWFPFYKKILKKGKLLLLIGFPIPKEKIMPLVTELGPKGIFLVTSCSTEEEARKVLEDLKMS